MMMQEYDPLWEEKNKTFDVSSGNKCVISHRVFFMMHHSNKNKPMFYHLSLRIFGG
jgi:hypothetical protein